MLDRIKGKIMFIILGTDVPVSYELYSWMRTDANEGKRIEVKLSTNQTWYLDFKSLFKIYQFLEQLRIFQYKNLDLRDNKTDYEESNYLPKSTSVKLNVFSTTFNMARSHQDIDFKLFIPSPETFNVIIWGA